ncbi:GAF domain-containing protein, partial [bacterium]|nr:GAF domain-containing protein [bacterium]
MLKFLRQFHTPILYSLIIFIFILLFITIEFIFAAFFPRVREVQVHFFKALIIVIIYEPLRKLCELYIKKLLFNYYFKRQTRLIEMDTRLSPNVAYKELADTVTERLKTILHVKHASLYLKIPDHFSLVSSTGTNELFTKKIRADVPYYEQMLNVRRVFDVDEILDRRNGYSPVHTLSVLKHEGAKYVVPLLKKDGISGFIALGNETDGAFELSGEDKKILWSSLQRVGNTLESARLYGQLQKNAMERELMLDVAKQFNSTFQLEKLLDTILDAIKRIVPYDAAGIFLVNDKNQEIESAVVRGYDEVVLDQLKMKVGTGLIGHVAKIGKTVIVKDVTFDEHYVSVRGATQSEMTIPICDGPKVVGVLNLESDKLGAYHEGYLEILTALAGEAAIAIKNAQLNEEAVRKKELEKELQIAGKIQQAILPQRLPHIENLDLAGTSRPCYTVGGDFFDLLKLNDHQLGVCIGDVSGKGIPGAIMMSLLYAGYRGFAREFKSASETVSALNNMLCANTAENTYATFFYGIIDFEALIMYYTNAGHCPPLI